MAYKYAKGKVYRGDIYNEDDTQRNTFIDFSEDAVGIIVGNAEGLVVSGSGAVSSSLNVSASGFTVMAQDSPMLLRHLLRPAATDNFSITTGVQQEEQPIFTGATRIIGWE